MIDPEPQQTPFRRPTHWHTRGILWGLWVYLATLGVAGLALAYMPVGNTRTMLFLLPFLAALLMICTTYWVYHACDDHLRQKILRSVARTAVFMVLATLGYFCLELMGYPRQSMIIVNLTGWVVFCIQLLVVLSRGKEQGAPRFDQH